MALPSSSAQATAPRAGSKRTDEMLGVDTPTDAFAAAATLTSAITSMPPAAFDDDQLPGVYDDMLYLDMDNSFDAEATTDYSLGDGSSLLMEGRVMASPSPEADGDLHEKRQHDQVSDDEAGGGKRREGESNKAPKKPGRKLATVEPTTKRKAQNRAAQRAFRERKEKHLQDLEDKVQDLQAASESANHENSRLRAQIEKMSGELKDYKRRLATTGGPVSNNVPMTASYIPGRIVNNPNDVDFQFEFPKFGKLPGPATSLSPVSLDGGAGAFASATLQRHMSSPEGTISPQSQGPSRNGSSFDSLPHSSSSRTASYDTLSAMPTMQFGSRHSSSSFEQLTRTTSNSKLTAVNRGGVDHSSPSVSSTSNGGMSSSCGTSPEPSTLQSPNHNGKTTSETNLTTIGEETSSAPLPFGDTTFDLNGIDWLAAQNNNQFDPQLFGDYREPLDNILSLTGVGGADAFSTDNFFSDAFAINETSSTPTSLNMGLMGDAGFASGVKNHDSGSGKGNLIQSIDAQANAEAEAENVIGCHTIWDRLQACKPAHDADFDIDSLCKDMQKKAKCTETGAVMRERDFDAIVRAYGEKVGAGGGGKGEWR